MDTGALATRGGGATGLDRPVVIAVGGSHKTPARTHLRSCSRITRRGKRSWQLKFDVGIDAKGKRKTRYVTVRGTHQKAQKELTRLLAQADAGTLPDPSS